MDRMLFLFELKHLLEHRTAIYFVLHDGDVGLGDGDHLDVDPFLGERADTTLRRSRGTSKRVCGEGRWSRLSSLSERYGSLSNLSRIG